jgi:hypothetical protein
MQLRRKKLTKLEKPSRSDSLKKPTMLPRRRKLTKQQRELD